jgi:catechol 2,3-dioxygenase
MTSSGAFLAGGLAGRSTQARGTTPGVTSAGAPMRIGTVALTVRDLDMVSRFYQRVIGLTPVETGAGLARLGVGETVLLELRHDPAAPLASPRAAGLFHTAFLLPNRTDLAQWLLHAAEQGVSLQGASDHLVSEAIYLQDPDGLGIEVYADRPRSTSRRTTSSARRSTLPIPKGTVSRSTGTGQARPGPGATAWSKWPPWRST